MDKKNPADWAIDRAMKLIREEYGDLEKFNVVTPEAFARYIEAREQPPVDRKLLCAREAAFQILYDDGEFVLADRYDNCELDGAPMVKAIIKAITLYEEGFGSTDG